MVETNSYSLETKQGVSPMYELLEIMVTHVDEIFNWPYLHNYIG